MTFRSLCAPVAVAVLLLAILPGCSFQSSRTEPTAGGGSGDVAAGTAAYDRKDYAKACQELSSAGTGAGFAVLTKAGDACAKAGATKAAAAYQAALAANPTYAPALAGAGIAALAAGDVNQARDRLEAALAAGSTDPRAALALGDAYLLGGNCPKALGAFQKAAGGDPAAAARLSSARLLCAGSRSVTPSVSPSGAGQTSSPSYTSPAPATGPKEPAKGKAPRTIDLNDI